MKTTRVLVLMALAALPPVAGAGTPLPVFTDVTEAAGIRFKHSFGDFELSNIVEGTGAGAMFFDYDGDGWLDIYLVTGCWLEGVSDNRGRSLRGKLTNRLYRSNHDGTFTDVTEKAGVPGGGFGVAASAADYDDDGHVDLYVLNYGPNILYHNNGDGTFTDVSKKSGLADPRWSVSAVWFDYDNDGDLDVYVANYLEYDSGKFRSYYAAAGYPGPLSYRGQPDALYRNNGDGTFTDVSKEAGVFNPEGRAMSASAADLYNDGHLDLYVANDAMENFYYESTGKGAFRNRALELGLAFGEGGQGVSSMGPCVGDVDRDGRLDLYIPDMNYGCLFLNRGTHFEDRTTATGLAIVCGQYTGWGGLLFDCDNDGYLDLFVANGDAHHEYGEEDTLMRNDGKGKVLDVAKQSGPYFREKFVGRGAAYGDFDNDGDLDLLIVNLNGPAKLLRNDGGAPIAGNGHPRNWLTVAARRPNGKSEALGARVTVTTGSLVQIHDLIPATGYLSQSDPRAHFGLGDSAAADLVEIRWPNGRRSQMKNVRANQFLKAVQDAPNAK